MVGFPYIGYTVAPFSVYLLNLECTRSCRYVQFVYNKKARNSFQMVNIRCLMLACAVFIWSYSVGVAHHMLLMSLYDDVTQFSTLSSDINAAHNMPYVIFSYPEIKNVILFCYYNCMLLAQSQ